ncbi:MAG: hypothetical protein EAZ21_16210, partial [Betaproteobacteria bacterium]
AHGAFGEIEGFDILGEQRGALVTRPQGLVFGQSRIEGTQIPGTDPNIVRLVLHDLKRPMAVLDGPDLKVVQVFEAHEASRWAFHFSISLFDIGLSLKLPEMPLSLALTGIEC